MEEEEEEWSSMARLRIRRKVMMVRALVQVVGRLVLMGWSF